VPLFVYGSLLFPEVLQVLLGRVPHSIDASAPGWRVAALHDRVYPALVPGPGSARGLLLIDLSQAEWQVLDDFEAKMYDLRLIALSDGRQGLAYVCDDAAEACSHDWDRNRFASDHLPAYVERCAVWRIAHNQSKEAE